MTQNPSADLIANDSHKPGSQLLGFLPPGGSVLVLSPGLVGRNITPPVMAIPIAELFVKHESPKKTAIRQI